MRRASLFLVHLTGIYLRWACCSPRTGRRPLLALIDLQREKRKKEKSMEVFHQADADKTKNGAQSRPSGIPSGPTSTLVVVLCNFLNGAQRASNYSSQKKAIFFHSPLALGFFWLPNTANWYQLSPKDYSNMDGAFEWRLLGCEIEAQLR